MVGLTSVVYMYVDGLLSRSFALRKFFSANFKKSYSESLLVLSLSATMILKKCEYR